MSGGCRWSARWRARRCWTGRWRWRGAALKPLLGDSAGVLEAGVTEAAVAAERVAMRARRMQEADSVAQRLRVMLVLVTLLGGAFGGAMLLAASRRVAPDTGIG